MQQPDLEVRHMPTDALVPYAGNAKEHPEEQVGQIAASINQFGFNDPVGIWHDPDGRPIIVEGHGRVLAAKELGIEQVPVVTLDHLDDEGRRAYTLAHNQTTLTSGFDADLLAAELEQIENIDMSDFGFDADDLSALEGFEEAEEDELPAPEDVETRAHSGELWRLGDHIVLCGDATNPDDMARLMGGAAADMLLTDPPYNVGLGQENGHRIRPSEMRQRKRRTDGLTLDNDYFEDDAEFEKFLKSALSNARDAMRAGAAFYIWYASMKTPSFWGASERSGLQVRQNLIWAKNTFALGRQDYQWMHEPCLYGWKDGAAHHFAPTRCETTVYEDRPDVRHMGKAELVELCERLLNPQEETTILRYDKPAVSVEQPTMKPVKLFARLIRNSSSKGDTVLDPFLGSGTTVVACEQMGRRCYGMELDPRYCDVILQRWENLTGGTAELLEA